MGGMLFGIIGYPLGHSLSPLIHNWGFERFGLPYVYEAWPTPPEELAAFAGSIRERGVRGVSVTLPHKTEIIQYLDGISGLGEAVGAVNTLYWKDGRLLGENTDALGVARSLEALGRTFEDALVLGGGGAARAAVVALKELGVKDIAVANRTAEKAAALAAEFKIGRIPWEKRGDRSWGLLVNATPLGMSGRLQDLSPMEKDALAPDTVVFDLVYNPCETNLLRSAKAAGCAVVPGLEMFLHQAVEQFRLWTGKELPDEQARALLMDALYGA